MTGPSSSPAFETWPLRDGPDLPREAVELLLGLENDGLTVIVQALPEGDRLRVSRPDGAVPDLSDDRRDSIRKWKGHLIEILRYCENTNKK